MMGRCIVGRGNRACDERFRRIASRADEIVAVTIGSRPVQIAAQVCCLTRPPGARLDDLGARGRAGLKDGSVMGGAITLTP